MKNGKKQIEPKKESLILREHNNKLYTLQRQNDIIAMLLGGVERREIIKYVVNKYKVTPGSATVYVTEGVNIIRDRKNFEIDNLISLHIYRYEYIYTKLYEIGAWGLANQALKAKEKLLGFHKQGFHMKVTQGEIQQIHQTTFMDEYDLNKVSEQRREVLNTLFEKSKRILAKDERRTKRQNKQIQ